MREIALVTLTTLAVAGCNVDDAQVASHNLSKAADNFEITRRVVFMNGITDTYMLEVIGLCSLEDQRHQLEVTCKTQTGYIKHFLGLSDNVTYFAEQLDSVPVSVNNYRVTFKPQVIFPEIDLRGSFSDLSDAVNPMVPAEVGPQ